MQHPKTESFKQLTISVDKLPDSMARHERQTAYAAERARLLLGCYRTGDANDPATYVAAVTAVLAKFPEEVITEVTHPALGLPSKKSWLPTVKEVFDACVKAVQPMMEKQREAKILAETLAARTAEPDRTGRPSREELQAKRGRNWGLKSLDEPVRKVKPAPTWPEIEEYYKERPGRLQWLADRQAVMRGEIADTPEPEALAGVTGRRTQ